MNGLLFHMFVISPGVRYMLRSFPNRSKNERILGAILFLTAVSTAMFLQDSASKVVLSGNYFSILQVGRDASRDE